MEETANNNDNKLRSPDVRQGLRGNFIKSLPEVKVGKSFDRVLLSLLWCLTVSLRHVCLGKFTRKSDHEL